MRLPSVTYHTTSRVKCAQAHRSCIVLATGGSCSGLRERVVSAAFYHVKLVGVSFYQTEIEWCCPNERVWICYEPDNPHDALALRVETAGGRTIGYIGRTCWLRRAIYEQGRGATAAIASINAGDGPYLGVVITVALTDDDLPVRSYYPGEMPPEAPPGGFRAWISDPVSTPSSCGPREEERTGSEWPTPVPHPLCQPR